MVSTAKPSRDEINQAIREYRFPPIKLAPASARDWYRKAFFATAGNLAGAHPNGKRARSAFAAFAAVLREMAKEIRRTIGDATGEEKTQIIRAEKAFQAAADRMGRLAKGKTPQGKRIRKPALDQKQESTWVRGWHNLVNRDIGETAVELERLLRLAGMMELCSARPTKRAIGEKVARYRCNVVEWNVGRWRRRAKSTRKKLRADANSDPKPITMRIAKARPKPSIPKTATKMKRPEPKPALNLAPIPRIPNSRPECPVDAINSSAWRLRRQVARHRQYAEPGGQLLMFQT